MTHMQTSDAEAPVSFATSDIPGPSPAQMREAMGIFASGVTVVTGMDAAEPVGFACQSFASVSLEPALVLFCADHRGSTWPRIKGSGRFTVNVLGEAQNDLCTRFGSSRGTRFENLDWSMSAWGTPALPGVMLRVHAEVYDVHVDGDHDVVVGRVLELESGAAERPMIFYRGGFGVETHDPQQLSPAMLNWGYGDRWG